MSGPVLPRSGTGKVRTLDRSVQEINRNRRGVASRLVPGETAVYSKDGAIANTTVAAAMPWVFNRSARLHTIGGLRTAGTTDTVVDCYRDAVQVATLTISANGVVFAAAMPEESSDFASRLNLLRFVISTAGTGASGLTLWAWTWEIG